MITLYSNNCPRCKVLKQLLDKNQIPYQTSEEFADLINLGFQSLPILKVEDKYLQYQEAITFVSNFK